MKHLIILFLLSSVYNQLEEVSGYLREVEMSFCMDQCSDYYIETSENIYWPIIFNEDIQNIALFNNRFVKVSIGEEVHCTECSAYQVQEISLSSECELTVDCTLDPCEIASECQTNIPVECIANYCGGCYADFFDLNNNLIDCIPSQEECENGEINNENPCNPSECWNGEWYEIIIDCEEPMGVPCLGGVYIPPDEGECCSQCILLGDVNYDSHIDVLDIVLLVSYIFNTDEPTDTEIFVGDINSDQLLNVLDVIIIIQMILISVDQSCYIEPEVGPCEGLCPTYYFNQNTNECEEFMTGCCGIEAFNTLEECQNICE
tara:strand:- start:2324 stop:3277 length:954 start_codon:yes stop_codon:yes gene_type:complete